MSDLATVPREDLEATIRKWAVMGQQLLAENNELRQQLNSIQPFLPDLKCLYENFVWSGDTTSDEYHTVASKRSTPYS